MSSVQISKTEGAERELFRRQIYAGMRVAPRADLANALSVVMLALYVAGPAHRGFGLAWMALALLTSAIRPAVWFWPGERGLRRARGVDRSRLYLRTTAVEIALHAVLNTTFLTYLLPRIDPGRQTVVVATFAGILGAGAVALSTVRSTGVWWVVMHVLGAAPVVLALDQLAFDVLLAQLVVYGGVLVAGVVYLADSYERRSLAEINARRAHQFVEILLDDFEDGSRDWLWETDSGGALTRASERLAEVSGHTLEALRGVSLVELLARVADPSEQGRQSLEELVEAMERGVGLRDHLLPVRVDGSDRWWSISAKPRKSADGTVVGWRGVGSDTTEAHTHALDMVRLAQTDPLTALANRRLFQESLDAVLDGEPRAGEVHLAIFDLDNFKAVNDTLGHSVGDQLLAQVATRLAAHDPTDFVARLGGDEFAVVTQPAAAPEFPELLFARYQEVFDEPFSVRGNRLHVSASVGCAHAWPGSVRAEELVGMADLALYAAKAAGAGRLSAFTASMSIRARERAALVADLDLAIQRGEFVFHYQPQHDLGTGKVAATEALLRWQHPTRGLLLPSEFLEVAEESGLLVPIGAMMLRQACRRLAGLEGGVRLAFNVSQTELSSPGFLDHLERCLDEFGVDPRRLELEVTETAAATPESESLLREVQQLGVRIAIDDFGVGYSSLARLQGMPVDVLKVDRAFAAALNAGSRRSREVARAIMKAAVDIGSALGIQVLAEGIEDEAQLALVRRLGFDLAQGFFVATPVPEVTRHLRLVGALPSADAEGSDEDWSEPGQSG
jgi:diguanylate cyclase (GGDEF)-like protein/PAS domain S-box-containing protein